jgi:SAM-dependent methyltransferase
METVKSLEYVLGMKGGNGDSSYVNNSSGQLKLVLAIKPLLEHSIYNNVSSVMGMKGLDNVFRIADLGCATGMNTLLTADTIVKAVKLTFIQHSMDVPEFQVYFADLPSNDFNTLFRTLPPLKGADGITAAAHNEEKPPTTRSYFASAVSGSHYGRLFPRQTLHFCHSSMSLHWLSQVPASVADRHSVAWNGGHLYISSDAVADAYLTQFREDLASFLEARAEEIVPGGCMFIAFLARSSGDVKEQGGIAVSARHLEEAFKELVKEGLIEEEKLDSLNLPLYGPTVEELQSVVGTEQSFEIESMRLLSGFPIHPLMEVREGEEEMAGRIIGNFYRSLYENIVGTHLGWDEHLVDNFFTRIANRATAKHGEFLPNTLDLAVAFLVRKRA